VRTFDLSTPRGRFATYWRHFWKDHAYVRLTRSNAHWISDELVRANQPWPFQVKMWKGRGISTIVNLRNGYDAHHVLEQEACDKYGVKMVCFGVTAIEAPSCERVLGAKALFETLEYPVMMHCKSGSDRAGLMGVLYLHFRKKLPIREAIGQLSFFKYGHMRAGREGVLDHFFETYLRDVEPLGISFEDWVKSPAYDHQALTRQFRGHWLGNLITGKLFRRELS
jgi:protein tyrosine/serine phosphatase